MYLETFLTAQMNHNSVQLYYAANNIANGQKITIFLTTDFI